MDDEAASRGRPLRALVVGAGIGGLAAAVALRRVGCDVEVLEQAPVLSDIGAGIQVAPNASRILADLGLRQACEDTAVRVDWQIRRRWENGQVLGQHQQADAIEQVYGAPYWHMHRADLHQVLIDAASRPDAHSAPIPIRLNHRVADINTGGRTTVTLASGQALHADVVVAADGVHSTARAALWGADAPTFSGDVAYRALIPADALLGDPVTAALFDKTANTVWMGPGRHLVHYLVRGRQLVNIVAIVPGDRTAEESWSAKGDLHDLLAEFRDWDPRLLAVLEKAAAVSVWGMFDREPLPGWVCGNVALLGDACHPMLPYQAQGAAQAIEDAVALADALRTATPTSVPSALHRYESARLTRASRIQAGSRGNRTRFHLIDGPEQLARDTELAQGKADFSAFDWLWGGGPDSSFLSRETPGSHSSAAQHPYPPLA